MKNERHKPLTLVIDGNPLIMSEYDRVMLLKIFEIVDNNRNSFFFILKREENSELLKWLKAKTPVLQHTDKVKVTISLMCDWVFKGYVDFPKCENPNCSTVLEHSNRGIMGYPQYCCQKCEMTDKRTTEKIRKYCIGHYGTDWASKDITIRNKCRTSYMRHFSDNKAKASLEKRKKQTTLERHGNANYRNHTRRT